MKKQVLSPVMNNWTIPNLQILLVLAAFVLNFRGMQPEIILNILVAAVFLSTLLSGGQYMLIGYGHLNAEVKSPGR